MNAVQRPPLINMGFPGMWINGQPDDNWLATDRGLHYGDGLFETIRIHNKPLLLNEHLLRLQHDCSRLGINYPTILIDEINCFLADKPAAGVLKILLTRGTGGRGYRPAETMQTNRVLQFHPLPEDISRKADAGISVLMCRHPVSVNPLLAGIKHLNRLDQVLASRELSTGFDEGFMNDPDGFLIEGTRSNVFLVLNNRICTPDINRAGIAGIMRAWLIQRFAEERKPVTVCVIPAATITKATEIFVCNSVFGIWPVTHMRQGAQNFTFETGPMTRLAQYYARELFES